MFISKNLSLCVVLVFVFNLIFPAGAAFAETDYAKFSSSYIYINADKGQNAGTVTVRSYAYSICDAVYITVTLPDGVEFTSRPKTDDEAIGSNKLVQTALIPNGFVASGSNYITVWVDGKSWDGTDGIDEVRFDFTSITGYEKNKLDIDKEFSGNLEVNVEVIGVDNGDIVWSISDDLTIAKVVKGDITISAGNVKKVSVGELKKVARITVEEYSAYSIKEGATITLTIETDDVKFNSAEGIKVTGERGIEVSAVEYDDENTTAEVTVIRNSNTFPGIITFDPIYLDIALNVKEDIKITVKISNPDRDETVTVATVGDAIAKIDKLENNDIVVFCGQITALDTSMKIETEGTAFKAGGIITFRLNRGEFAADPDVDNDKITLKRYDYNKAFFVSFGEDVTNFTLDNFKIALDNDIEPGYITLTISGDYGNLDDVIIGAAAVPIMVKNTDPSNGATGINSNITIQVSFNQKIKAGIDFNRIGVKDNDSNVVDAFVFIEGKRLIISPVDDLGQRTTYTVIIPSTAITDFVGNPLVNDYQFTFTTESPSNINGGGGGKGGTISTKNKSVNDISEKVNDLLENASKGDVITVNIGESGFRVINKATLRNVSDTGCNLSISAQDAGTNLIFEPGTLLINEFEETGNDSLVEIAASMVEGDKAKEAANYAISVGGRTLRTYEFSITVKKDEKEDGRKIHNLNGNVRVILDLSDMDLDDVNTDLLAVIHQQPDETWVDVESVFDPKSKTISFTTNCFSLFAVIERWEKESKVIELTIGQVKASVDGDPCTLDVKPYVDKMTNRTFVPLRFVSEALGAKVDWDLETNNIVIKDGDKKITLTPGSKGVLVNNDIMVIDTAPEIISPGRCFVPLRFISETIGAQVNYEPSLKQITITTEERIKEL